jgi:hypothetical protein
MERGEWWLDERGDTTFADGDVGDKNHEMIAFYAALCLNPEENEVDARITPGRLTPSEARLLRMRGVSKKALDFFSNPYADARDYAIEHMGWIRVKNKNVDVWELDDKRLRNLKNADFWHEEDEEDENTELYLEERSTGKSWSIPFKTLLSAKSAEGLKKYMEGSGKWHRGGIDGLRGFLAGLAAIPKNTDVRRELWILGKELHRWFKYLPVNDEAKLYARLIRLEKRIARLIMPGNGIHSPLTEAHLILESAQKLNDSLYEWAENQTGDLARSIQFFEPTATALWQVRDTLKRIASR